jgi:hypothetical protein
MAEVEERRVPAQDIISTCIPPSRVKGVFREALVDPNTTQQLETLKHDKASNKRYLQLTEKIKTNENNLSTNPESHKLYKTWEKQKNKAVTDLEQLEKSDPVIVQLNKQIADLKASFTKIRKEIPFAMSIISDYVITACVEKCLEKTLACDKKTVKIDYFVEFVRELECFYLIHPLPSIMTWTAAAEQEVVNARSAFKKALKDDKQLNEKGKEVEEEVVNDEGETTKTTKFEPATDEEKAESERVKQEAKNALDEVEQRHSGIVSHSKHPFNSFIRNAFKDAKDKPDSKYKEIRGSDRFMEYLSCIVSDLITRFAKLTHVLIRHGGIKMINVDHILQVLEFLLTDSNQLELYRTLSTRIDNGLSTYKDYSDTKKDEAFNKLPEEEQSRRREKVEAERQERKRKAQEARRRRAEKVLQDLSS